MSTTVEKELAALEKMTTSDLQATYRDLFGDEAGSSNRRWLFRRCAWRMQALAEGGPLAPETTTNLVDYLPADA